MRDFDYLKLKDRKWDSEMVRLIAKIHETGGDTAKGAASSSPRSTISTSSDEKIVEIRKVG